MYYVLSIDIGASSGRHILGSIQNDKLILEEIYRFENNLLKSDNGLEWDLSHLFSEVVNGIKRCEEIGKIPKTIAIDTWGVDYVLIDAKGQEILPSYSYRDSRTELSAKEVAKIIGFDKLYSKTGIQRQNFNTVFQLYDDMKKGRLDTAKHFLMMPEYLSYKLTGKIKKEYTNATTTGLVNAKNFDWDYSIIECLGLKKQLFESFYMPQSEVGNFSESMCKEIGFDSTVILCPSHDTASAVAACPLGDDDIFISSGTWSLIGCEMKNPVLSSDALDANFTNEGGIDKRFRFLKNIMGMWLFQNIRKDLNKKYTYDEMMKMAMSSKFTDTVDVNAPEFVAPQNMLEEVRKKLCKPNLPVDDTINCVYHSFAKYYASAVDELESITGKTFKRICIVGGGCKDEYLNRLTAKYTSKTVTAGPVESTATGNIISQLIYNDKQLDLKKARELVKKSFSIKEV